MKLLFEKFNEFGSFLLFKLINNRSKFQCIIRKKSELT